MQPRPLFAFCRLEECTMKKQTEVLIKMALFGLGIVLALICLHGCTVFEAVPTLSVVASPSAVHPPCDITITAVCSQEGGTFTLSTEGEDLVVYNKDNFVVDAAGHVVFVATVDGWPYKAAVTWTDGTIVVEAAVRVALENEVVVPHGLWTEPNNHPDRGLVLIDLRYLEHGCLNGTPVSYTGFEDPDGDSLKYRVEVEDRGVFESVFYGDDRTLMGRTGFVDNPIFYWFVNYIGEIPIYQYGVWSPLGCQPAPSPGGEETREKRIHIYVLEVECNAVTHWAYDILTADPG